MIFTELNINGVYVFIYYLLLYKWSIYDGDD